jgi:NaMN:DMB phosphoribosyltransferase
LKRAANYNNFSIGETILGKTSGATAVVANTFISEVSKYSGDIIYVENKTPLTRLIDQTDNLHLVLEF